MIILTTTDISFRYDILSRTVSALVLFVCDWLGVCVYTVSILIFRFLVSVYPPPPDFRSLLNPGNNFQWFLSNAWQHRGVAAYGKTPKSNRSSWKKHLHPKRDTNSVPRFPLVLRIWTPRPWRLQTEASCCFVVLTRCHLRLIFVRLLTNPIEHSRYY